MIIKYIPVDAIKKLLVAALSVCIVSCANFRAAHEQASNMYQPGYSKLLVDFSVLSYIEDETSLINQLSKKYPNYKLLRKIEEDETGYDAQGFVAYNDENIIVAIRGSSSAEDWFNNFKITHFTNDITKSYCPEAAVHGGFHRSALVLKNIKLNKIENETIYHKISTLQKEGRKLYFTGHSLGGAIANVLAFFTVYETTIEVDGIYTFGEPKSGNEGFRQCHDKKLSNKTFRFINNRDLVARVPPSTTYVHVGNLIYFDTYGDIYDQNTYNSFIGILVDMFSFEPGTDHFKESYLKLVTAHKDENPFLK